MKKFTKALIIALTLALGVALAAIFALAGDGTPADSATSPSAPTIVSKNISYSSYLHIMYAIPVDGVDEGYTPYIELYSEDPATATEPRSTVTPCGVETLTAITGESEDYYVFKSYGIAPKNITSVVYAVPKASDSEGNTVVGKTVKYSVAEYCYERLCAEGYALVNDKQSKDYLRRELYESLLEYGRNAYTVLGGDGVSPNSFSYFSIFGTTRGSGSLSVAPGDELTFTYDPTVIPKDFLFMGWRIVTYSPDGNVSERIVDGDSVTVKADLGGVSVMAIHEKDPVIARAEQIAEQEIIDAENKAAQWVALEEAMVSVYGYSPENASELTEAMQLLYTLYGSEMVTWVASLYAKGFNDIENGVWAGGFYASTAGRDAYGYGPDLQCTVQLLRFLNTSGVIDSFKNDIPVWMQQQMVYFAKSLQHENGYFYHPQWGKEFTDTKISRRGRDLGWGTTLLKDFGELPQYDTPAGVKGDGQSADEYLESIGLNKDGTPISDTNLTSRLGSSVYTMVSKVILVDEVAEEADDGTSYLKSHTAFINYLLTYVEPGMRTNQYSTGNTLNATNGQIGNYSNILGVYTYTEGDEAFTEGATADDYKRFDGMTMKEMVLEVLLSNVNPLTGLYGGYQQDGTWLGKETLNFSHSNGFFKVISIINSWGGVYPYASLAAESLIANLVNENLPSTGNACEVYNVWNAIISLKSNASAKDLVWARVTSDDVITCSEGDEGAIIMTVKDFLAKSLEVKGADAVRITYAKIKGYKKADGAFSHSYYSGGTNHQGCPVSPAGNNVGDVDATCIASTGLVRSMFDAFEMGKYRPDFFGKADYYRFIDYLEAAAPINKCDSKNLLEDFEDDEYKNKIDGDAEIKNGTLTVNGNASVSLATLSTVGPAISFSADIYMEASEIYLTVLASDSTVLEFRITRSGGKITLTNTATGSYAVLKTGSQYFSLAIEIYNEDGTSGVSIYENGLSLYTETFPEELPIKKYTDVTTLSISTNGAVTVDNMIFAILTPTYSIINDQNRIDFENISTGKLNVSHVSGSINFTNQTAGLENESVALVIVENNNKFLRLEDNFSTGSSGQSYFEFKGTAKICETAVFEARMRINTQNAGFVPITIFNSTGPVYYGTLKISSGYLYAGLASSKSGRGKNMVKTDVSNGEWFTVRLEYTAADEYSADTFLCSIYINDKLVSSSSEKCDGTSVIFGAASGVYMYRMAADTNWTGTIDYDDIFVGAKQDYKPLENSTVTEHTHSTYTETTDIVEPTCSSYGSYTVTTKCETCGEILGVCYVKTPTKCTPAEPVVENRTEASCYIDGSYDSVTYCSECGKEVSREAVKIPSSHTVELREENRVESTYCGEHGSVDMVEWCTACGKTLRVTHKRLPTLPHDIVDGACKICGATEFVPDGYISYEDIVEGQYASIEKGGNTKLYPASSTGSIAHIYFPKNYGEAFIVSEDGNKYLLFSKVQQTQSNPWINFFRDTTEEIEYVLFETRFRFEYTTLHEGYYFRMYTGRTTSSGSDGKRLFNDRVTASDGYLAYKLGNSSPIKTHVKVGDWSTIRLTLTQGEDGSFTRTFWVKNETTDAITYKGVVYAVGEFIPYAQSSTGFENTDKWSSINDVNCITFLPSSNHVGTAYFDDSYIGGEFRYVSK